MGFSKKTNTMGLPQFQPLDKPTWQADINGAFNLIDKWFRNLQNKIDAIKLTVEQVNEKRFPRLKFQSHDVPPSGTTTIRVDETVDGYLLDFGLVRGVTKYSELKDTPNLSEVALTGNYNSLEDRPNLAAVAYDGEYRSLLDAPNVSTVGSTGNYNDLENKPTLHTVATTGKYTDLAGTPNIATVGITGKYTDLTDTPNIATVGITGKYDDLVSKPTLSTVATTGAYNDLVGKPTINPDSGWIDATLLNAWYNLNAALQGTAAYRKSSSGAVYVRGVVQNASATPGATIFTLPVNYRPTTMLIIPVASGDAYGQLYIDANGDVRFGKGTPTTWVSLSFTFMV